MKVERLGGHFCPIAITIESVNEAMMLADALRAYQEIRKESGFSERDGTPKDERCMFLLVKLRGMGY